MGHPAINASESNCAQLLEAGLTYSGRKIGQSSGLWCVLFVMLLLFSAPHANLLPNKSSDVSAKLPLLPDQVSEVEPTAARNATAGCPGDQESSPSKTQILLFLHNLFLSQVADLVPNTLRRLSRLMVRLWRAS